MVNHRFPSPLQPFPLLHTAVSSTQTAAVFVAVQCTVEHRVYLCGRCSKVYIQGQIFKRTQKACKRNWTLVIDHLLLPLACSCSEPKVHFVQRTRLLRSPITSFVSYPSKADSKFQVHICTIIGGGSRV